MTALLGWLVASVLLVLVGGAMVVADYRRRRAVERARAECAAREARLVVRENLFEPPPRRTEE